MHLFFQLPPYHWQYLFDFDNSIQEVLVPSSQTFALGDTMTSHDVGFWERHIRKCKNCAFYWCFATTFRLFSFSAGFTCQLVCLFSTLLHNIKCFSLFWYNLCMATQLCFSAHYIKGVCINGCKKFNQQFRVRITDIFLPPVFEININSI